MHLSEAQCQQLLPVSRRNLIKGSSDNTVNFALTNSSGILIFECSGKKFVAPYVKVVTEGRYRRARKHDAVTANLLGMQLPDGLRTTFAGGSYQTERFIEVDQSNESVVVDETIIVKWQLEAHKSIGAQKEETLTKNGFRFLPALLGNIYWNELLLASVNTYIPETTDGWTWCVAKAKEDDLGVWLDNLSLLTKEMHGNLEGLTHGDFHVGQILKGSQNDDLWVIDFEGDPLSPVAHERELIHDIASMCASFFHVGAVAIKYGANIATIKKWITRAEAIFLNKYFDDTNFNLTEIHSLMRALENRELVYADKFLPQWRYAPEYAITLMEELNYGSD